MKGQFKLHALVVAISFLAAASAHAESESSARARGGCESSSVECSDSVEVSEPTRAPQPPVQQPAATPTNGACGQLPLRYGARSLGATCGNITLGGSRFPERVNPEKREMWNDYLLANAPEAARLERRNTDIGWRGTVNIPKTETWQWTEYVGDYDHSESCYPHNPTEALQTTCSISRERVYYTDDEETDYDNCLERAPDPAPVEDDDSSPSPSRSSGGYSPSPSYGSSSGSSRSRGSDYSAPSPSRSRSYDSGSSGGSYRSAPSTGPSRGGGESRRSMRKDYGFNSETPANFNFAFEFPKPENYSRRPAGECLRYGTKTKHNRHTESISPITYACVRNFPRYCVHPVVHQETRACAPQPVAYEALYVHFPKGRPNTENDPDKDVWKPGYVDPKFPYRNYNNMLPNRFDLLLGEDEHMDLTINTAGQSTRLAPALKVESLWNEYEYSLDPKSHLACGDGTQPFVKINIHTIGRIKHKMPNALELPTVVRNGKKEAVAFTFEQEKSRKGTPAEGRPAVMTLNDTSRSLMLDASLQSRIYGRSTKPSHIETSVPAEKVGTAANGGFWVDTQYKMELYKKDKWGNWIRMTRPTKANQNNVSYNDNMVSFTLLGKNAVQQFYRPVGSIFESMLGKVYDSLGFNLTPGDMYYVKVWMVTRGLPWYEEGCRGGKIECEGEQATKGSYSDPIVVPFRASKDVDHRSFVQKIFDLQEKLAPF